MNIILINNHKLGMVRQLQHDVYGKNHYSGTDLNFSVNFMKLAEAYGITGFHAETTDEAAAAIESALALQGPTLIECMVSEDFLRI